MVDLGPLCLCTPPNTHANNRKAYVTNTRRKAYGHLARTDGGPVCFDQSTTRCLVPRHTLAHLPCVHRECATKALHVLPMVQCKHTQCTAHTHPHTYIHTGERFQARGKQGGRTEAHNKLLANRHTSKCCAVPQSRVLLTSRTATTPELQGR